MKNEKYTKHSEEERQQIISLKLQGMKDKDIASKCNVKFTYVRRTIKKANIKSPEGLRSKNAAKHSKPEDIELVKNLRLEGFTKQEIADKTGFTFNQVLGLISKSGVTLSAKALSDIKLKTPREIRDEINNLRKQGKSFDFLANKFSMKSSAIRNICNYDNVLLTKEQHVVNMKTYTKEQEDSVKEARKKFPNLTVFEVAKLTNVAPPKVKKILIENSDLFLSSTQRQENAVRGKLLAKGFESWEDYLNSLVKDKGEVLGKYVDNRTLINCRCLKGSHCFDTTPARIVSGNWCPYCTITISKGHQEIIEYINSLGFDLKSGLNINNRTTIAPMELDIFIPESNFALEYNGLYWHSLKYPEIGKLNGTEPGLHALKSKLCQERGIKLLAVFEDEWNEKQDLIKSMIKWRLNKFNGINLNARELEIRKLESNNAFKDFFNRNHLDGHVKASFAYGLFYNGKLVCCASIRTNFNKEFEIARFATDHDFNVRGGAGKIFKHIVEECKCDLVSFSNNRLGFGNVYKELGFEKIGELGSSYWYTNFKERIWRFKCKRINNPDILAKFPTEKAQALGGVFGKMFFGKEVPLFKIEDYGHKKWMFKIPQPML